jgi:hypothetical protein
LIGFLAGYGGEIVVQNRPLYGRIEARMKRWGSLAVFVLAAIPNPAFDIAGITGRTFHMHVWQFLMAGSGFYPIFISTIPVEDHALLCVK